MRTIRVLAVVTAFALTLSAAVTASAGTLPIEDIPYDVSSALKQLKPPRQHAQPFSVPGAAAGVSPATLAAHGEPDLVLRLYSMDPAHPQAHDVAFWKESAGVHSDVYIAWDDLTPPRESGQQAHAITSAQVEYLADEFDRRIWASDVFHFGWYERRTPANAPAGFDGSRAAILVYNIRDEAYYGSYPYYVAGYFWGGLNDEIGLNAIFVDSFDWANRLGPDAARPYLYEGTVAHEFEHLIHADVDPDEDSFVDEGMADLAEQFIYGTATTSSHIGEYLYYHRDSLLDWDGELYDYGGSVLWQDYLWERMGGGVLQGPPESRTVPLHEPFEDSSAKFTDLGDRFIWQLAHNQQNGLDAIDSMVGGRDATIALHRDYLMANFYDSKTWRPSMLWQYRNLALGGPDSDHTVMEDGLAYYKTSTQGGGFPPTRKRVPANNEPWGAYLRAFSGADPVGRVVFSGPAESGVAPRSGDREWYTGLGNDLGQPGFERTLTRVFDRVEAGSALSFWTWYDIEGDWDYGYVEASTDGVNWRRLSQVSALPAATSNRFGSSAYDGPGGLTGSSDGWRQATYSLGGLSGTVWVRFDYRTDEAVNGIGWFIDDVTVGAASDPISDATSGLWSSAGWLFFDGMQDNRWTVDVYVPAAPKKPYPQATPMPLTLSAGSWSGSVPVDTRWIQDNAVFVIESNHPDFIFRSAADIWLVKKK